MTARRTAALILAMVLAASAGYAATRLRGAGGAATAPADPAIETLMNWLGVPAVQRQKLRNHDPAFAEDLRRLREELARRRAELAAALEKTDTPDETIFKCVEATLAASNALERRVAQYLMTVRHHLTPEQQCKLFGLCAEGVRQACGRCCRRGQSDPGQGQRNRGRPPTAADR